MSVPVVQLSGVKKSFGPVDVLKGVELVVEPGKVTALVGDNGAGKSTLIKVIFRARATSNSIVTWPQ